MKYTKEEQKEHRDQWVKALRSGKYQQGRHRLRTTHEGSEDAFCCLGIACDVSGLGTWRQGTFISAADGLMDSGVLPDSVMKWLGLSDSSGCFSGRALTTMNDEGISFSDIADVIEKEPEGLVVTS